MMPTDEVGETLQSPTSLNFSQLSSVKKIIYYDVTLN